MTIGERIKKRRKEIGMSVETLAEKLGKNRATIYRYESDQIENMPLSVIEPLAKVLNVSPAYLMGMDEEELKGEYNKNEILKAVLGDITMLPIVGTIRAGEPILAMESVEGYFPMDNSILNIDKKYFFRNDIIFLNIC